MLRYSHVFIRFMIQNTCSDSRPNSAFACTYMLAYISATLIFSSNPYTYAGVPVGSAHPPALLPGRQRVPDESVPHEHVGGRSEGTRDPYSLGSVRAIQKCQALHPHSSSRWHKGELRHPSRCVSVPATKPMSLSETC